MRFWLISLICLLAGRLNAQNEVPPKPWVYGAYAHGGFIIAHSPFMRHLAVSHPTGCELNLQKQTTGKQPWHQLYKFPKVGYSFIYFDFQNPVLGKSYAASTYLNKTLLQTKKGELNYRLGLGIAYLTNVYNQESNYKNSVASSALNATMHTRFEYDYRFTPKVSLLLALGLNHYSNGATKKPNMGINVPTASIGLNYRTLADFSTTSSELPAFSPELFYTVSATGGLRQINVLDTKKYLVQSLTISAHKPLNRKSNAVIGLEGFFDRSLKVQQQTDTTLTGKPFPDTKKAGVYLGHDLLFGNLTFEMQLGLYVYRPYKAGTFYYERLGLKYHLTPRVFGEIDLKLHGFAADVLEWRLGYKF